MHKLGGKVGCSAPPPPLRFTELDNSILPQSLGSPPKTRHSIPLSKECVNYIKLWSMVCLLSHWSIILNVVPLCAVLCQGALPRGVRDVKGSWLP